MENPIPENSVKYLTDNKIATVCFVDENHKPYCINCFYAFDTQNYCLIMKSSKGTHHENMMKDSAAVSGTILPETIDTIQLKGMQFTGHLMSQEAIENLHLKSRYLKKFPMSLAIKGYIWAVKLEFLKHTDNTFGFGNKKIWSLEKEAINL